MKKGVKSCVIDSEAVAWDKNKKTILPFQVLFLCYFIEPHKNN